MSESDLHRRILVACGQGDARLFRVNTGLGWAGDSQRLQDGSVLVRNARPLHAGLVKGGSDLIGWRSLVVTPEHVGRHLAVFVALEVKDIGGRLSGPQRTFLDAVKLAGGIAGVVRSTQEAEQLVNHA